MKRGQKREMRGHNRGRVKSRFWFSVWSWLSVLHMPAANLCVCDLERLPQDIHNLCQLNTERDREREWAQRWPKHISRGNLLHPGGVYAAKSINFQLFFFFFCPTQHAIKQESKRWRCLSDESERCTPLLFSSSPLHTSVLSLYPSTSPFLTVLLAFFLFIPTMGGFSAVSLKLVIKRQPLILQEERSKRRGIKMGERWSKWREDRKVGRKGKSGGRIYDFRQESGLMQQFPKSTTRDKVTWSLIFHLMYFEHLKNDYCICKLKGKTINTFK